MCLSADFYSHFAPLGGGEQAARWYSEGREAAVGIASFRAFTDSTRTQQETHWATVTPNTPYRASVSTHDSHEVHGYLIEARQAEHLPSVQEVLSIPNTASQRRDPQHLYTQQQRQEGQELKASPDYMRPHSQNISTGQQDDGSAGNLVTPISP